MKIVYITTALIALLMMSNAAVAEDCSYECFSDSCSYCCGSGTWYDKPCSVKGLSDADNCTLTAGSTCSTPPVITAN